MLILYLKVYIHLDQGSELRKQLRDTLLSDF